MTNNGKLNDDITEAICKDISDGVSRKEAAMINGTTERTFYNWIKRGQLAKSGQYVQFFQSIKRAESGLKADYEKTIYRAKDKDWKAAMTYLERKHPSEYGKSDSMRVEHSGKVNIEIFKKYLEADSKID